MEIAEGIEKRSTEPRIDAYIDARIDAGIDARDHLIFLKLGPLLKIIE